MGIGSDDNDKGTYIDLEKGTIEVVDNFTHPGSNLAKNGQLSYTIKAWVAKAAKA